MFTSFVKHFPPTHISTFFSFVSIQVFLALFPNFATFQMWPTLSKRIIHVIQGPPVVHPLSKEILDNGYSTTPAENTGCQIQIRKFEFENSGAFCCFCYPAAIIPCLGSVGQMGGRWLGRIMPDILACPDGYGYGWIGSCSHRLEKSNKFFMTVHWEDNIQLSWHLFRVFFRFFDPPHLPDARKFLLKNSTWLYMYWPIRPTFSVTPMVPTYKWRDIHRKTKGVSYIFWWKTGVEVHSSLKTID